MIARILMVLATALPALAAAAPQASAPEMSSTGGDTVYEDGISAQSYAAAQGDTPALLYINGCFGTGCRFAAGSSSSISNTSSLLKGTANVQSYPQGEAHFGQVVDCVRDIFEPFGISVTDQDPGATPHFESVVGGSTPQSLGFPAEIGGVAPFSCGIIPNSVSFVFPTRLDGSVRQVCETIAHEVAHTWGLEHTYMCEDTMTYLSGCGQKEFEDVAVQCGEDQPRNCECSGTTQNSYRTMIERFGAANPTPPTVNLLSPAAGARVDQGFAVSVEAEDDTEVRLVELWIDGQRVASKDSPPWNFEAPPLGNGLHVVEVRALDDVYTPASALAEVRVGAACTSNSDCDNGDVCAGDVCIAGPRVAGGLGTSCQYNDDCETGICQDVAFGDWRCVTPCAGAGQSCPDGFACEPAGLSEPACVMTESAGCRTSRRTPGAPWALLIAALGLVACGRRRP